MKYISAILILLSLSCSKEHQHGKKEKNNIPLVERPVDLVNPLVGSASSHALSNGNTYPAIAVPWGMNFWTPQTGNMGNGWAYTYDAYKIRGFKQTHQPSPWINDYGAFSIMPVVGHLKVDEDDRASWFSHKIEISKPHYYSAYLGDYDTQVEITPTDRCAQFRITYPESDESFLLIDGFHQGSMVEIDQENKRVTGYCKNNSGGVPFNFSNYFVLTFDKDFEAFGTWNGDKIERGKVKNDGAHVGAILKFKTGKRETVQIKVASSFISHEQAALNLERELGDDSFDQTRKKAENSWNKELSRIEIEGGTEEQRRTFYTALYRTLLFPRKFYELNEKDEVVHYSPYNGEVLPGYMFTDNGFWDTFRAVFPFFTVMYQELNAQIMQGLVNTYKESGWLPEWASPGHRDCMIGSNSASIIADSYLKGIRGYDIEVLYEAILKNTENEGPVGSVGRMGAEYYNKLGYIPYDVGIRENVARSLEYAYADFTIWKLARELKKSREEISKFYARANNYKNLFDPSVNFMRGKLEDGQWQKPFNEFKWGDAFTEGNSWHYTWSVFQDPAGLADLMGGPKAMEAKLDELFETPPVFDFSYYGFQIHEITEMVIANMGQYAHGNQPMQHGIYLYNYVGAPWKAQKWARTVMNKLYTPYPDGLCGDEDNGQTSAWYVFSSMGLYPVCPGQPEYVIGSPLFEKVKLHLENGNTFEVIATNNAPENFYIQHATLNGKPLNRPWINHEEIMQGSRLGFEMDREPNQLWASDLKNAPYSMSNENK
ncbi:MAG: GH92 family glycosyl hydrolase [Cytophagales bacterium]|nr:GH92 family glycosyl hydrolase [Cytophagales bacterium]